MVFGPSDDTASLSLTLLNMPSRAATNYYFDNRLVGRLFFRLIGLNIIILLTNNTQYSTFCSMSFKQTECYEDIQCLIYQTTCHKEKTNILGICQKKKIIKKFYCHLLG